MPTRRGRGGTNIYVPRTGRQAIGYARTDRPLNNTGLARANNIEHAIGTANALNNAARVNGTYLPGNRAFVRAVSNGGAVTVEFS